MKKALTIYVDDDAELINICGGFATREDGKDNSVTFLNEIVPKEAEGVYLPMDSGGINRTQWVSETGMIFRICQGRKEEVCK